MGAERKPVFFAGKDIKIGIIGCGYVGLPLLLRFADVGQRVTGFDTDKTKTDKLNAGESYIQHILGEKIRSTCRESVSTRPRISHACARWTRC
jgi:UDP-N-acetyl-D-glucosamine dehydrogenase